MLALKAAPAAVADAAAEPAVDSASGELHPLIASCQGSSGASWLHKDAGTKLYFFQDVGVLHQQVLQQRCCGAFAKPGQSIP
jgi:hypothetical protein